MTKAELQNKLGDVLTAIQSLWDVDQPTSADEAVVQLMLLVLTLRDPANINRLRNLIPLVNATATDRGETLVQVADLDPASGELNLIRYMLTPVNGVLPSWGEMAAKVVELAINNATPNQPQLTMVPQQPAPQAPVQPQTPAGLFSKLVSTVQSTSQPVTSQPAAQPAPTPAPKPAPPKASQQGGQGNRSTNRHQPTSKAQPATTPPAANTVWIAPID